MHLTPDPDLAWMLIAIQKVSDGRLGWSVACSLPGTEMWNLKKYLGRGEDPETASEWLNDLHNERKSWGSLIECVASDWISTQGQLL